MRFFIYLHSVAFTAITEGRNITADYRGIERKQYGNRFAVTSDDNDDDDGGDEGTLGQSILIGLNFDYATEGNSSNVCAHVVRNWYYRIEQTFTWAHPTVASVYGYETAAKILTHWLICICIRAKARGGNFRLVARSRDRKRYKIPQKRLLPVYLTLLSSAAVELPR